MTDAQLRALARAVDAKDAVTSDHSMRVAQLASLLARQADWCTRDVRRMYEAGLVHDAGKMGIPEAILRKPGRLTEREFALIKLHPDAGADMMISAGPFLDDEQLMWIREHHERPDGRGYPRGMRLGEGTDGGCLLAVADAFDVMCSERPYKQAQSASWGVEEAVRYCGRQFLHRAVRALEDAYREGRLTAYDAAA